MLPQTSIAVAPGYQLRRGKRGEGCRLSRDQLLCPLPCPLGPVKHQVSIQRFNGPFFVWKAPVSELGGEWSQPR